MMVKCANICVHVLLSASDSHLKKKAGGRVPACMEVKGQLGIGSFLHCVAPGD